MGGALIHGAQFTPSIHPSNLPLSRAGFTHRSQSHRRSATWGSLRPYQGGRLGGGCIDSRRSIHTLNSPLQPPLIKGRLHSQIPKPPKIRHLGVPPPLARGEVRWGVHLFISGGGLLTSTHLCYFFYHSVCGSITVGSIVPNVRHRNGLR